MSQLLMTQPSERTATNRVSLIALAVIAMSFSGCAHMYENVEMGKTSLPPHYPHPFEAPVNYGYFPTLWRAWPGAESIPGQSVTRNKDEEEAQKESTSDTLPEPSTESAPESGVEPGMENVFDLPEGMQNEAPEGGAQPNMEPLPDQLIPPENEAPAATTTEEPQQPAATPEAEQLPDQLIPAEEGAAPPESSTMHEPRDLEELPFDAPEGNLIPETAQPIAAKPRPGLLMPNEPKAGERQPPRIENAMRPGTRQGAKVLLSQPENALRELAGSKAKAAPTAEDAFADGPQLLTPVSAESDATVSKNNKAHEAESSSWQSTRSASKRPRMTMPMAVTTAGNANATADEPADENWRPSRGRGNMRGPALQATAVREQTRSPQQTVRREYPAMQVGHTENVMRDNAAAVGTASGAANPLR